MKRTMSVYFNKDYDDYIKMFSVYAKAFCEAVYKHIRHLCFKEVKGFVTSYNRHESIRP